MTTTIPLRLNAFRKFCAPFKKVDKCLCDTGINFPKVWFSTANLLAAVAKIEKDVTAQPDSMSAEGFCKQDELHKKNRTKRLSSHTKTITQASNIRFIYNTVNL